MADPGAEKPPRLKHHSGPSTQHPTWKVTRRERTETSPLRRRSLSGASSSSSTGAPTYHSRTITTTERVQILQMPLDLSRDEAARIRALALTPTGEAAREVHSTTTTIDAGGRPVIGALTSSGVPLYTGIYMNNKQRQTTTVITTTTTTYKILDDSSADEYEMLMTSDPLATALTVDVPLQIRTQQHQGHDQPQVSNVSYVMVGSQTESSLSPITTDDDAGQRSDPERETQSPELITLRDVGQLRELGTEHQMPLRRSGGVAIHRQEDSFEMVEQPTSSSGSADEADYVQVEDERALLETERQQARPVNWSHMEIPSTSLAYELEPHPLEHHANVYNEGFYEGIRPSTSQDDSQLTIDFPLGVHYQGPVDSTHRRSEMDNIPLQEHVQVFHPPPIKVEHDDFEVVEREKVYQETVERREKWDDYPQQRDYPHPVASTSRHSELDSHPLHTRPSQTEYKSPDAIDKIKSLFRKDHSHDYPPFYQHEGPVSKTRRHSDLHKRPLEEENVRKYHEGFYEGQMPSTSRGPPIDLSSYPDDIYEGPVEATRRHFDIEDHPMEFYVDNIHHGHSDLKEQEAIGHETKPSAIERLTSLFKKERQDAYPSTSVYEGPTSLTSPELEAEKHDLHGVYHQGYYTSLPSTSKTEQIEVKKVKESEAVKESETVKKVKESEMAKEGYPMESVFEGQHEEIGHREFGHLPLESHVRVYSEGRSDLPPPKEQASHETKSSAIERLTSLFKKERVGDYPDDIYDGPTSLTSPELEAEKHDLHGVYHQGYYTSLPSTSKSEPIEVVKKVKDSEMVKEGYPTKEVYSGPIEETERRPEAEHLNVNEHVIVYHSGDSGVKRGGAPHDYPPTQTYTGEFAPTSHQEAQHLPINEFSSVYHHGRSDIPAESDIPRESLTHKISSFFKKEHKDEYPKEEQFLGQHDDMSRSQELDKHPIESYSTVYAPGHYTHLQTHPTQTPAEVIDGYKRHEYPVEPVFEGQHHEIGHREAEHLPINEFASIYHEGRSDLKEEKEEKKPGFLAGLFGKEHKEEYPKDEKAYEGPHDDMSRSQELDKHPLESHVSVYAFGPGFYEQVPTQKTSIVHEAEIVEEKPQKPTKSHYPTEAPYSGPLSSTHRHYDAQEIPLSHHVSVYHTSGRSDVHEKEEPAKEKTDLVGKISSFFKKDHKDEYSKEEQFLGQHDDMSRSQELDGHPIESFATIYHSTGRSDLEEPRIVTEVYTADITPQHEIVKADLTKERPVYLVDQPIGHLYEGPVSEMSRQKDIVKESLDDHILGYHKGVYVGLDYKPKGGYVEKAHRIQTPFTSLTSHQEISHHPINEFSSVYHHGRSDIHEEEEHPKEKSHLVEKLTSLFKKEHKDEYPHELPYEGPLSSTHKHYEFSSSPLEHHVTTYHPGHYSTLPRQEAQRVEPHEIIEEKTTYEIHGVKKEEPSHYGLSPEPYSGPLSDTHHRESPSLPIEHFATIYHHGRSDIHEEKEVKEPKEVEKKPSFLGKLFKRGHAHEDFPRSDPYSGDYDSLNKHYEAESHPLKHHVSPYHEGFYHHLDQEKYLEPVLVEEPTTYDILATKKVPEGYPLYHEYLGPLDSSRHWEAESHPLEHHVSTYHEGHYEKLEHDVEKKPSFLGKLFGKSGHSHLMDFPQSETYSGPYEQVHRYPEIPHHEIEHHVTTYHQGHYDKLPKHEIVKEAQKSPEPSEEVLVEEKTTYDILATKKVPEGYPLHHEYSGPLETIGHQEIGAEPLGHHVTTYHQGHYDKLTEAPQQKLSSVTSETTSEKKPSMVGMLTGLFRRYQEENYPSTEPYEGPLSSTHKHSDFPQHELSLHSTPYHAGHYNELVDSEQTKYQLLGVKKHEGDLYRLSKEKYEGPLSSTHHLELPEHPIHELVSATHPGFSDLHQEKEEEEPKQKRSIFDKIGLTRKETVFENYPSTELYEGPLTPMSKDSELDKHGIWHHVALYHQTGRSDSKDREEVYRDDRDIYENIPSSKIPKGYPTSTDPYHGPVDSIGHREIASEPLGHHVTTYHEGHYDHLEHEPAQKKKSFFAKFFGKGGHSHMMDQPVTEPYLGPVDETRRYGELESHPLEHHVSVYHTTGRSDLKEEKVKEVKEERVPEHVLAEEPTTYDILATKKVPEGYPLYHEYLGPLDSSRHWEAESHPLKHHVSTYNQGFYEKLEHPKEIKVEEKPQKLAYPVEEVYSGDLSQIGHKEFGHLPLESHVSVYHSGRSDVHEEKEPKEVKEKTSIFGKLFKRGHAHEDFPRSDPYSGNYEQLNRHYEAESHPLEHHVSPYHEGFYQKLAPISPEPSAPPKSPESFEEKTTYDILATKKVPEGYPLYHEYLGPLDSSQHSEFSSLPLEHHVSTYNQGFYEKLEHPKEVKVEGKPVKHVYPVEEPYSGQCYEIQRFGEAESLPLESHVSVYHSGRSDIHEEKELKEVHEKKPSFFGKLFKRGHAHEDFPRSDIYSGPYEQLNKHWEAESHPLDSHVTNYGPGFYLSLPRQEIQQSPEPFEEPTTYDILATKKVPEGYPLYHEYLGPVDSSRHWEAESHPLEHHVSTYHEGFYEKLEVHEPEKKKSGLLGKLFKHDEHEDFPRSDVYSGPLSSTHRHYEIEGHPLEHHVSVYHTTGRSDIEEPREIVEEKTTYDILATKKVPEGYPLYHEYLGPLDSSQHSEFSSRPLEFEPYHQGHYDQLKSEHEPEKKTSFLEKLFGHSHAHEDFPKSEVYSGPLSLTQKQQDLEDQPLSHHVTVYHQGHYEKLPKQEVQKEAKIQHEEPTKSSYPVEEPFQGQHHEMSRQKDITKHSLDDHILGYHKGVYVGLDYKPKGGFVQKTHRIQTPFTSLTSHQEAQEIPLSHQVSVYHHGRSDLKEEPEHQEKPTTYDILATKKVPEGYPLYHEYLGPLDSSQHSEFSSLPLGHHVTTYHQGHYDQLKSEHEPEKKTSFLGKLFGHSHAHEDFPKSDPYSGPLSLAQKQQDLDTEPLSHYVSVYHQGHYEKLPKHTPEPPTTYDITGTAKTPIYGEYIEPESSSIQIEEEPEKKQKTSFIRKLFQHSHAHEDFPKSDVYEGPVTVVPRRFDIFDYPIQDYVSKYHSTGRSDEKKVEREEEKEKGDETSYDISITTKSTAPLNYPSFYQHEGPVSLIERNTEFKKSPLEDHLTVYPLHIPPYDKEGSRKVSSQVTEVGSVEKPKEKKVSAISRLFKFGHAHEDFPKSDKFEGHLHSTQRQYDIIDFPLRHHVQIKHPSGRSDDSTNIVSVQQKYIDEEDEPTKYDLHIVKKSSSRGFPISEPFEGPLDKTSKYRELDTTPLEQELHVYPPYIPTYPSTPKLKRGASEEVEAKEGGEVKEKQGFRFSQLFKRHGHAHLMDEPKEEAYHGPLMSLHRGYDIIDFPLRHHVQAYHDGFYTHQLPSKPTEPSGQVRDEDEERRYDILATKKASTRDYPLHVTFEGPLHETHKMREARKEPLEEHLDLWPLRHPPYVAKKGEKEEKGFKFSQLFRFGHTHLMDEPTSTPYTGPLSLLSKQPEHYDWPISRFAQAYHSTGRSDFELPQFGRGAATPTSPKVQILEHRAVTPILRPASSTEHRVAIREEHRAPRFVKETHTYSGHVPRKMHVTTVGTRSKPPAPSPQQRDSSAPVYLERSEDFTVPYPDGSYHKRTYDSRFVATPRSLSESRRAKGWTTVVEKTTVTYARHTSMERELGGGRRQRFIEDIVVHNYGPRPGATSPVSQRSQIYTSQPPYLPPYATPSRVRQSPAPKHADLAHRYAAYRSRSQDSQQAHRATSPPKHDQWIQTSATFPSANEEDHVSRLIQTTRRSHTYRSYSSHMYDREAVMRGYYPDSMEFDHSFSSTHRNGTAPPMHSTPLRDYSQSPGRSYQTRRNLHEVPITSLLDELPTVGDEHDDIDVVLQHRYQPRIVPLETRLMEPGYHSPRRAHHHQQGRQGAPMRRAQRRIRNYCTML